MIYSGAELIRTSGQQSERLERLKAVDPLAEPAAATPSDTNLDGETHSALLRFARFLKDDRKAASGKKAPVKKARKRWPESYLAQIELHVRLHDRGATLDIYA